MATNDRYLPIADYAIVGCTRSAALISRHGSLDWLCWPRFDSPSIFARILDHDRGGHFSIRPAGAFQSRRRYLEGTNVLETTFDAEGGVVRLIDLMPVMSEEEKRKRLMPFRQLLRRVECVEGEVTMDVEFSPRTDYGRARVPLRARGDSIVCQRRPMVLHLRSDLRWELRGEDAAARVTMRRGERHDFALAFDDHAPAVMPCIGQAADEVIERTASYWRRWSSQLTYAGPYRDQVMRSALVLKLLTYAPSGAIIAAPTTSLPERVGGVRNWDYRFCWLRDASFTVSALYDCGFEKEGSAFVDWLLYATRLTHPKLQILYNVFGEARIAESELGHLEGYRQSRPVRAGNAAHDQFQLDVYGEVLGAFEEFSERGEMLYRDAKNVARRLADEVVKRWRDPDSGIWEKRSQRQQHVHAKVMAWSALDCAERLAREGAIRGDAESWRREKEAIANVVLERGFDREKNSFVSTLDGHELDASLLYVARVGFLAGDDPRLHGTIAAIRRELGRDDLIYRYDTSRTEDGLPSGEGAFLPCSMWLVEALSICGRDEQAGQVYEKVLRRGNDVGLFSEEIDVESGQLLGNFPQALTHIGLLNAALELTERRRTLPESRRRSHVRGS